jgi:hypothetical protein
MTESFQDVLTANRAEDVVLEALMGDPDATVRLAVGRRRAANLNRALLALEAEGAEALREVPVRRNS